MNKHYWVVFLLAYFATLTVVEGRNYIGENTTPKQQQQQKSGYRTDCVTSKSSTDLAINNVRARLLGGGDMWWDGVGTGRYIVPNVDPASGEDEISSLFSGAIWIGAKDAAGNLLVAGQTFRTAGTDYWSGPLDTALGTIEKQDCENWDKHFTVYGADIDALRADFLDPLSPGVDNKPSLGLLGWPARGNTHFLDIHGFDIMEYDQDLAPFIDVNDDGRYDPWDGDHPIIEVTGCAKNNYTNPVYADQMTWWVYNDAGNTHTRSGSAPIRMEIQVTAFGYATTDAVNNMTFYRYKLLNRNNLSLKDTYFTLWSDPDLGCYADDYIGCDTATGMGYVYNSDLEDENPCGANAVAGYGTEIPALAVDYFRGPLDSAGNEIGLSSFQYHVAGGGPTGDPQNARDFYNYMSGFWRDGTPMTTGGTGYDPNNANAVPSTYAFPSFPNQEHAGNWSMCQEDLPGLDRRFMHTSGPFVLLPGATNEMISGVVWVPDAHEAKCPSLDKLVAADVLAQNLFNDCFKIVDGPTAPFIDIIEMDQELVLNLNYIPGQNNYGLTYFESPSKLKPYAPLDTTYDFQGYKIYQVNGPNVSVTELDNVEKARLVFQTDIEDDVDDIANWEKYTHANLQINTAVPVLKVEGKNEGLKHTFQVLKDAFAEGEGELINHKPYYFCVVAYAHNEYQKYNVGDNTGQADPYLQGRKNFRIYTAVPRINAPEYSGIVVQSSYGDKPAITRIDGQGTGSGEFLEIANIEEIKDDILGNTNIGRIEYKAGKGPINVQVVDPLRVPKGTFNVHICDEKYQWVYDNTTGVYMPQPATVSALSDSLYWVISDVNDPTSIWTSYQTMDWNYEQYIPDLGISVTIQQKGKPSHNNKNGRVGSVIDYKDSVSYGKWYDGLTDGGGIFNVLKTGSGEDDSQFDPKQEYSDNVGGWYPFMLCDAETRIDGYYLSMGNIGSHGARYRNDNTSPFNSNLPNKVRDTLLSTLNNVNIVMTDNENEWSRCIVVESANVYHGSGFLGDGVQGWKIPSRRKQMEWRGSVADPSLNTTYPEYASRNKDMSIDPTSKGMSWFPGYAYDVETGQRLNIFFGENSLYNGNILPEKDNPGTNTGNDMIFNPTNVRRTGGFSIDEKTQFLTSVMGGQHIIYVTNLPYDSCQSIIEEFDKVPKNGFFSKDNTIYQKMNITWASMAVPNTMLGSHGHTPPNEITVKLRVNRPYEIEKGTAQNNGYPLYEFSLDGLAPTKEEHKEAVSALDLLRVVPNPYYAYSDYEINERENIIKIINIPAKCKVRIYSLDGRFVRELNVAQAYRDKVRNGIARLGMYGNPDAEDQVTTSVEWDLKNYASVPVASGVYLVHVKVEGVGTRVLKSFIINRAFDAQRI